MITSISACASTACHTGWMPSTTNAASRRRCLRSASRRRRLTSGFAALVITSFIGMRAYSATSLRPAPIVATHQQAVRESRSRNVPAQIRKERQMGAESERVSGFGRLEHGLRQAGDWYRWGPYVSERQWGTVREDYSAGGDAWDYLPHDHARSRAYRWGEDGLAGFCDIHQQLCLGLALWNGRDPILKERAFGLTGAQGNHGEDVKEYWWYTDAVPSH